MVEVLANAGDLPDMERRVEELLKRIDQIDRATIEVPGSTAMPALLVAKLLLSLGTTESERTCLCLDAWAVSSRLSVIRALRPSVGGVLGGTCRPAAGRAGGTRRLRTGHRREAFEDLLREHGKPPVAG